jgi:hypothetical protein
VVREAARVAAGEELRARVAAGELTVRVTAAGDVGPGA